MTFVVVFNRVLHIEGDLAKSNLRLMVDISNARDEVEKYMDPITKPH